MITCVVEYVIDPAKIEAFERFGRRWIELVDSHGGITTAISCRPREPAIRPWRCSASPVSPPTSSTVPCSQRPGLHRGGVRAAGRQAGAQRAGLPARQPGQAIHGRGSRRTVADLLRTPDPASFPAIRQLTPPRTQDGLAQRQHPVAPRWTCRWSFLARSGLLPYPQKIEAGSRSISRSRSSIRADGAIRS
jgi:hypothetical protein